MSQQQMLTLLDSHLLADAFPSALHGEAVAAGEAAHGRLHERQWTERFSVRVDGEEVLIPARLHFVRDGSNMAASATAWMMERALQTRSNDGFERQRAVRDILLDLKPWSAPYVVTLIGEYVIEILDEIEEALTPASSAVIVAFIAANPLYWALTKQRVASYWNAYYRARFTRAGYVGTRLVGGLEVGLPALQEMMLRG